MADSKADDDEDDWGFGDFTFVPPLQKQSDNNDDDDWGDFVKSQNQITNTTLENNQSNGVGSGAKTEWGKLKGALPLSLFGENEEDEDKQEELSANDGKILIFNGKKSVDLGNKMNFNSGLGIDDIINNLYSQKSPSKVDENGVEGLKVDVNLSNLDLGVIQGIKNDNGLVLDYVKNGSGSDFGGLHLEFDGSKMASNGMGSDRVELGSSASMMNIGGLDWNSGSQNDQGVIIENGNVNSNVQSSNFGGWGLDFGGDDLNVEAAEEGDDDDDDGWEFKGADSELKVKKGDDKENMDLEFPVFDFQSTNKIGKEMQNVSQDEVNLFGTSNGISSNVHETHTTYDPKPVVSVENGLISDHYPQSVEKNVKTVLKSHPLAESDSSRVTFGEFNHFATENGVLNKSQDLDIGFDFKAAAEVQDATGSNSYLYAHTDINNMLNSDPVAENADSDEAFGEFEDAAPNTGPKQEEIEMDKENSKGPMPLSIFGIEEPETDASLDIQDNFISKPAHSGNGYHQPPSLSINDILENLYSQSEPIPVNSEPPSLSINDLCSSNIIPSSDIVDDNDDFEDGSWEFKDAASQLSNKEEASHRNVIDARQSFLSETKMNTYLDFYCTLKDELQLVCRFHLRRLKQARSTIALSGDDFKLAALDEEIQDASKELLLENILYKEDDGEEHLLKEICLQKFVEVLHGDKFQALESEYELSRKLALAEKEFKSAIELIKHATAVVKILTLVSEEDQSSYISTWYKMLSVCTRELHHGSWILKQSLEKDVQSQILSEAKGKQFFLALGEIYRVVLVLGASVKLYKPWLLSRSVDSTSMNALFEECHNLWACSGLEETLQSIADLKSEYNGVVGTLLASIKNILDVDVLKFNQFHGQQKSVCALSGLNQGLVPDIKIVDWEGEHYFLTLANLWANLVSCDPPKLAPLEVG